MKDLTLAEQVGFSQLRLNRDGVIVGSEYLSDLVEKGHGVHKHGKILCFFVYKRTGFALILFLMFCLTNYKYASRVSREEFKYGLCYFEIYIV